MSAQPGFVVRQPGLLTLIQDLGRYGFHHLGLTTGGPMDPQAFCWANRLCDNKFNIATLEITLGGLVLECQVDTVVAVTGADMPVSLNGKLIESWRSHRLQAGDELALGFAKSGCRSYLAVAGGFMIKPAFSSVATVTRECIGGLTGEQLKTADFLPCTTNTSQNLWYLPEAERPSYGRHKVLRVVGGYQQNYFSKYQQKTFFSSDFQVSDRCNRMGYCLQGPAIQASINGVLSEGICYGAVQIPPDGQPIVLLNDRQTIGGYPKMGSVISIDAAALSQLPPRSRITFEAVSNEEARELAYLQQRLFQQASLKKLN